MSFKQSSNNNQADWHKKTDAELFLLFQEGQKDVLTILYDRHAGLVYGIALKLLQNTAEAEDLTQDIFLKLTNNDSSYNPQKGSLRTFLAILTRCRAIDRLRARNRYRKQLQEQLQNEKERASNFPIEQLSQTERSQEVREALTQLSIREQEVLKMAYYEGLSQSEISERLNIALGTIKSRSRRGLIKLRHALSDKSRGES